LLEVTAFRTKSKRKIEIEKRMANLRSLKSKGKYTTACKNEGRNTIYTENKPYTVDTRTLITIIVLHAESCGTGVVKHER
jgi:hypothetical protein